MKKETFFFLALVLAAAVITGSTVGIISNFDIIVNNSSIANPSVSEQAESTADEKNTADVDSDTNLQDGKSSCYKVTADSTELMVISQKEKEQIMVMLQELGMSKDSDYTEFIRNFQQTQSLNPTGNLDSKTLDAIIRQATLKRVADAVKD